MISAPKPENETMRVAALRALDVLDSAPEDQFNALVRAAATVTGAPVCLLSLVDSSRQWHKANYGLAGVTEIPRDMTFCAHTILEDDLLEVPDATQDPRFVDSPLVMGRLHVQSRQSQTLTRPLWLSISRTPFLQPSLTCLPTRRSDG